MIGPKGSIDLQIIEAGRLDMDRTPDTAVLTFGSPIGEEKIIALTGGTTFAEVGLADAPGGLNVVGETGFNRTLEKNLEELESSDNAQGEPNNGWIEPE